MSARLRLCSAVMGVGLGTPLKQGCVLGLEASRREGNLGRGALARQIWLPASLLSAKDTRSPLQHPGVWLGGSPLIRIREEGQSPASVLR